MRLPTVWLIVAAIAAVGAAGARVTPVTPVPGACDTANVMDIFGNLTGNKERTERIAIVQGRIDECARKIDAILAQQPTPSAEPYWLPPQPVPVPGPTQTPVCTNPPPANSASKEYHLYETLTMCVAYFTYLTALPTPEPTDTPPSTIASQPSFYVFALGAADDTAAAVLIHSVVQRLAIARAGPDALAIVPRASWTDAASFAAQCRFDPNTLGALVIETSVHQTRRANYLAVVAEFSDVDASVEVLGCGADGRARGLPPLSLASENNLTGSAHESALVTGTIATVLAFISANKTTTDVSESPAGRTTVTTTQPNPIALNGNLLSYYQNENLNLPAQNVSVQLRVASERFADATMHRLGGLCRNQQVQLMAAQANPAATSLAPPQHRTVAYRAAFEYAHVCALFGGFAATR